MPTRIRVIEITESGVHMRGDKVEVLDLADGTTREIRKRGHAKALGIRDFGGDRAAMIAEAERIAGLNIAALATDNVAIADNLREERAAKDRAIAERDAEREAKSQLEKAVLAERAEKAKFAEQLEKANAERDQLLLAAQRQNDPSNTGRG